MWTVTITDISISSSNIKVITYTTIIALRIIMGIRTKCLDIQVTNTFVIIAGFIIWLAIIIVINNDNFIAFKLLTCHHICVKRKRVLYLLIILQYLSYMRMTLWMSWLTMFLLLIYILLLLLKNIYLRI